MTGVLIRKGEDTQGEQAVTMETEIGVTRLQLKDPQGLAATTRSWESNLGQTLPPDLQKEPTLSLP